MTNSYLPLEPATRQKSRVWQNRFRWQFSRLLWVPSPAEMETKRGVSYTFLEDVVTRDPRFREGMDTTAIKKEMVMPDTAVRKCAYVDLYEGKRDSKGRLYVAPATAFVSHAWMYDFKIPLDVMKTHHNENPDAYFWYDVFINNQHALGQTDLGAAFSDAIEEIWSRDTRGHNT